MRIPAAIWRKSGEKGFAIVDIRSLGTQKSPSQKRGALCLVVYSAYAVRLPVNG
jgi:hypothetical protein